MEHVATVADPFTAGAVSPDGRIGFAVITFDRPSTELGPAPLAALADAMAPARAAGVAAELGGDAAFINAETETSGAEAAGLLAALVVLVVAFGTIVAALVPIALTLVAVAVGLGGITLLAGAMDVSSAAPTIGAMIGLGSASTTPCSSWPATGNTAPPGRTTRPRCPTPWDRRAPPSCWPAAPSWWRWPPWP